jgi:tRNA (pseudouridine54-N1)-methyltransferase
MRTFIVKLNHPLERFELNNLTKNRMDLVARCVNSAFWLDNNIRRDVHICFCFSNGKCVCVDSQIRGMNPDERSIAGFFSKVVEGKKYPGITLTDQGLEEVLSGFDKGSVYYLDKNGEGIRDASIADDAVFVLGDDVGLVAPQGARTASLGPRSYLASHCITVLNNYLDRQE